MDSFVFRVLDLFCGAGGAAMGYHQALDELGIEHIITGVDHKPMPRYPFEFIRADALEYCEAHGGEYDFIHASPPCQFASVMRRGRWQDRKHINLIPETRDVLIASGALYVIENVEGARSHLITPVMLCGTMFGLGSNGAQLRRHRHFECSFSVGLTPPCAHNRSSAIGVYGGGQYPNRRKTIGVYGSTGGMSIRDNHKAFGVEARREAMGITWMIGRELSQAIPPAYTRWIGLQIFPQLIGVLDAP